jgi:hypothetical protein
MIKRLSLAALLLSLAVGQARAGIMGTQGFADIGSPTTNTGDINTATVFTLGDLVSTKSQTGAFVGMPSQDLGTATLNTAVPTSLTFGDSVFGSFSSTSITLASSVAGSVSYYVLGNYTPGTFAGGGAAVSASFTLSFTQTPAGTGSISDSGTLAAPPAALGGGGSAVPEPASLVMGLIGAGIFGASYLARRGSTSAA